MLRLHLVRHPAPQVEPGVCYGRADVEVAPAQLKEAAARLGGILPAALPVYSSPARRCMQLAQRLHPTPILDARLAEMDFGTWELRAWSQIARAEVDAWADDLLHYRPGGGENVLAVARRVLSFRAALAEQEVREAIVVCHAGTMRLLEAAQGEGDLEEIGRRAAQRAHHIGYGEVRVVEFDALLRPQSE